MTSLASKVADKSFKFVAEFGVSPTSVILSENDWDSLVGRQYYVVDGNQERHFMGYRVILADVPDDTVILALTL